MLSEAVMCLALAIYHEARGEPLVGQMAVAEVVMNRVAHPRWANEVCKVVKRRSQFSFYWDGKSDEMQDAIAKKWAIAIADSYINIGSPGIVKGATCYTTLEINNKWTRNSPVVITIGSHKFMDCGK